MMGLVVQHILKVLNQELSYKIYVMSLLEFLKLNFNVDIIS